MPAIEEVEETSADNEVGTLKKEENMDEAGDRNHISPSPEKIDDLSETNKDGDNNQHHPTEKEDSEMDEDGYVDILGSGDLMKKIVKPGCGMETRPERGSLVKLSYSGKLDDGTEVDTCECKEFVLGDGDMIHGLEMAVTLMELEETCELKINARFAYGERGRLPDIPSNATVTYQLSLLGIYDAPDLDSLLLSDRIAMGDSKRERGNYLYSREEYSDAINSYSKALKVLDDSNIRHSKEESTTSLQELQDLRLKCFNNLAAAQLKIDAHTAALQSCDNVLKVQPDNVKALFRKGKVLGATGETQEAILVLRKALKLEPEMKIIHQELSRLVGKHQREEESSKEMYRRMMGEMTTLTDKSTNSKNTSMWTKVAISVGAISAAALSVVAYKVFHLA